MNDIGARFERSPDGQNWLDDTIAARFERQVAATPDAAAVLTDAGFTSYRALNALADGVAGQLRSAVPGDRRPVVLMMQEYPLVIATVLGAAKAGRVYIPLDMSFPAAWLAQIVEDSGAGVILTDAASAALAQKAAQGRTPILEIGRDVERAAATAPDGIVPVPRTPAYVLYTSGSSGRPKGVMHGHQSILHHVDLWKDAFGIGPGDRVALLTSVGFGAGTINTYSALLTGACLCPFDLRAHGVHGLAAWMQTNRISAAVSVSSFFRTWLAALSVDRRYPDLRLWVNVSEPLYSEDIERAARHFDSNWIIAHTLAMSEAGSAAIHAVRRGEKIEQGVQPVGWPVADMDIRLEDESHALAPANEVGEIVLRSHYLALGYWNDPAATASVFSTAPDDDQMRIYRTGDLGRWRKDGKIEYLGRKDRKFKLRGFTIELYEIERALMKLPGIHDAVAMVMKDNPERPRLAAYVIATGNLAAEGGRAVRAALAARLPAHMVPPDIVVMASFPLTSRGKIDRNALPKPPDRNETRSKPYRAPATEHERALSAIWEEVLEFPKIGIDDDFYELNGTSLQAFTIFGQIATKLGRDLPPTTMMSAPTIAQQAELISRTSTSGPTPRFVPFRRAGAGQPLFVVHGGYGDIMFMGEIVRALKSDRPVYGLQPPPLDGSVRLNRTVESVAAQYLADIREIQPNGPYFLAGYSFGGWVALEMAQRLRQQGEQIAFLGLIDTLFDRLHVVASENTATRADRHWRELRKRSLGESLAYARARATKSLAYYAEQTRKRMRHWPHQIRMLLGQAVPYTERAEHYYQIYWNASFRYRPQPYSGPITVFSAAGLSEWHRSRWKPLAMGGLAVHEVPAAHSEMVWPPFSAMLAEHLDGCLAESAID